MRSYGLAFERLADAADAAAQARLVAHWECPALKTRCTTTEAVYGWPDGAPPTDGGMPVTWNVPGYGSHATADDDDSRLPTSLCGFTWSAEESARAITCSSAPTSAACTATR